MGDYHREGSMGYTRLHASMVHVVFSVYVFVERRFQNRLYQIYLISILSLSQYITSLSLLNHILILSPLFYPAQNSKYNWIYQKWIQRVAVVGCWVLLAQCMHRIHFHPTAVPTKVLCLHVSDLHRHTLPVGEEKGSQCRLMAWIHRLVPCACSCRVTCLLCCRGSYQLPASWFDAKTYWKLEICTDNNDHQLIYSTVYSLKSIGHTSSI